MLNQKTVLIVGAGASAEFDFPIGSVLLATLKEICAFDFDSIGTRKGNRSFARTLSIFATLNKLEENIVFKTANSIALRLAGSHKSIDQLIHTFSHNPNFVEIAKLAIAFAISEKENNAFGSEPLAAWAQSPWKKENWIDAFTSNYFSGYRRTELDQVYSDLTIICFNYDRCVEYGFARALAFQLDLDDQTAIDHTKKLTVIHPYGHLGNLPENRAGIDRKFVRQSPEEIVEMARHIKTFTEDLVEHSLSEAIGKALDEAPMVISLGFGYQPPNIRLLSASKSRSRSFAGTTFEMSESDSEIGPSNLMQALNATVRDRHSIASVKASKLIESLQLFLFR